MGNMFIADSDQSVISKIVISSNVVSIYAGISGVTTVSGDGGPATSATLNTPTYIWGDSMGNMFVIKEDNNIRMISPTQLITVYMSSCTETNAFGDGGPATSGCVPSPKGLAQDTSGNMYIAQLYSKSIRQINKSTGLISTYSISGNMWTWNFWGETHHCNCMYFTDAYSAVAKIVFGNPNVVIRVVDSTNSLVRLSTGDGGPASLATLNPAGNSPYFYHCCSDNLFEYLQH
jgi:hypothetical protein